MEHQAIISTWPKVVPFFNLVDSSRQIKVSCSSKYQSNPGRSWWCRLLFDWLVIGPFYKLILLLFDIFLPLIMFYFCSGGFGKAWWVTRETILHEQRFDEDSWKEKSQASRGGMVKYWPCSISLLTYEHLRIYQNVLVQIPQVIFSFSGRFRSSNLYSNLLCSIS